MPMYSPPSLIPGNFANVAALIAAGFPAATSIGKHATVNGVDYVSDGVQWYAVGTGPVRTAVTATGVLAITALGAITPVNAAGATLQTLPDAATAFALMPYGLVVLSQKGAGAPTFTPAGSDVLRATSGVAASVQYGMIAAQIVSATEWALA